MADIVARLIDRFSPAVFNMRSAQNAFNSELQTAQTRANAYRTRLDELTKTQSSFEVKLVEAKRALKEAEAAFKDNATAANSEELLAARRNYDELSNSVNEARSNVNAARSSLRSVNEEMRRMQDGSYQSMSSSGSVLTSLASAGLFKQLGGAAAGLITSGLTSGMSSEASGMFSSVLSGAASGAAMGSIVPGIGTAIGGLVGAVSGAISGATEIAESRREAAKAYYNELFDELESAMGENLTSGINVASSRQTVKMSYKTLLGGDEAAADEALGGILDFANRTPFSYGELTELGRKVLSYKFEADELTYILSSLGGAASAIGGGSAEMSTMADVIGRLHSGVVSQEQLNRLIDIGLNPYTTLAEAYNNEHGTAYGDAEIRKLISNKGIDGGWAASTLLSYYQDNYAGSLEEFSHSFAGLSSTMDDMAEELQNAMGEGYAGIRSQGMEKQLAWYDRHGDALGEAYGIIGESKAYAENYAESLKSAAEAWVISGEKSGLFENADIIAQLNDARDGFAAAVDDFKNGTEEEKAAAGFKIQSVIEQADGIAQAYYDASDIVDEQTQATIDATSAIREATSVMQAWKPGYAIAQEKSKGISAFGQKLSTSDMENAIQNSGYNLEETTTQRNKLDPNDPNYDLLLSQAMNKLYDPGLPTTGDGFAYGLNYVPYDGFPAVLHQGERVLTAAEARKDSGANISIGKLAETVIVREEADIDKIAEAFARNLKIAADIA